MQMDTSMPRGSALQPAGWLSSSLLFGVPALRFFVLFHFAGPRLHASGVSWWLLLHILLIAPLAAMLLAAIVGASREGFRQLPELKMRFRLQRPKISECVWAGALAGFMYGGDFADVAAVLFAFLALRLERHNNRWIYPAVVIAVMIKRSAGAVATVLQSGVFFIPSQFYQQFFGHFGPSDFMGVPLKGAWWLPVYYACLILIFNIGGEELWWRGYVLPRQQLAFPRGAWVIHGVMWSAFHVFMQPTLWDTTRMAITGVALAFVVHRTRNTWTGIIGHTAGNLHFFLSLVRGVYAP